MLLVLSRLDHTSGGLTQDTAAIGILELLKYLLVKEPPGGVLLLVDGLIRLVLQYLLLWRLLVDPCYLQLSHLLIAVFKHFLPTCKMIVVSCRGGLHTGKCKIPRVQLGGKVLILVQLLL
jgi:hypothetical protein